MYKDTKAADAGLRSGDQILEVNGVDFTDILLSVAMRTLEHGTTISLTVKQTLGGVHGKKKMGEKKSVAMLHD